eukprot:Nitzschia sp. Nitz4//scaffold131_size63436//28089//28931//NITZ4_006273-RA/size63436-processed-gene-0.39-mRNA-1//1//CDS//3329535262//6289//frame0
MSLKKKRNMSVFDAIQELESQDAREESKRRKRDSDKARKGRAAQAQTQVYQHLVECRILMQRAVVASSSIPDSTSQENSAVVDSCNSLLGTLLQARRGLLVGEKPDSDEYSEMVASLPSSEWHELLEEEYNVCREEWKTVLNQRHKDLKLHSGVTAKSQFRVMDSSFWEQVDATVEYEQLRRAPEEKSKFDDTKLYQQLLKDFVANSSTAKGSAPAMSRVTKDSTQKKNVDRKASKGRKIRYKEIPKLVNFTFPLSRPTTSNLDQDEWFKSLFGGVGNHQ